MNAEQIINQYLKNKQEEEASEHGYSGLINASCLGQCHRRQFYGINKVEVSNPIDERTLRVFACGDLFHDFVQKAIENELKDAKPEQVFKDDVVSVRVDLLTDADCWEFKSMHSRAFWYMDKQVKEGVSFLDIHPEHILQLVLGCMCFKKENANLVYISKDDLCLKQFSFVVTEELKNKVKEEIDSIKYILLNGILPEPKPRLYGEKVDDKLKMPRECSYCNWQTRCFNERS